MYASPILQARPGSTHGYDICDRSRVNDELGGEAALLDLADALEAREMGLIFDVVPNHMAVANASNAWWEDVLEHGASSRFADYFDIDWEPVNPDMQFKVLLPILGEQYGKALESGLIRLSYADGGFRVHYYETSLPVAPQTYRPILASQVDELARRLGDEHECLLEYRSILTALRNLPPRTGLVEERQSERYREVAIIKRRLAALVDSCEEVRAVLASSVDRFNGRIGYPESFDEMDRLLGDQSYRPAFWRVAMDEINYRRFFDVNELAAIRIEDPRVFEAAHHVVLGLLAKVRRSGLRIDHPDGLYNPTGYFQDLQKHYLLDQVRLRLGDGPLTAATRNEALAALAAATAAGAAAPLYVIAEKILGADEPLPADWMIDGTSGYDFLNACNRLFLGRPEVEALERTYREITGETRDFQTLVHDCKNLIMQRAMASDVNTLSHQLDRITERNRRYRDFTLSNLREALHEFIAGMAIYRSYTTPDGRVSERDRHFLELACERAKDSNPSAPEDIFDFIRDIVLLRNLDRFTESDRSHVLDWVLRFQQVTGPIMAKGIEDTAFYVYNKLTSLNEVGGHPDHCAATVEDFHRLNAQRAMHWPSSMLSSSTHDTKRSEDVRARINVLAELAGEWARNVRYWLSLTTAHVSLVEENPAPSFNDEYLVFQTLLGTWPDPPPESEEELATYRDRIAAYMEKATKEAKQHTSWVNPNEEYDAAVRRYVSALLAGLNDNPFLDAFSPFARRVAHFGRLNSLSQTVLKLTCPGIPDIYQGNELWDLSLVDPDNRRPVDYPRRVQALGALRPLLEDQVDNLDQQVSCLLHHAVDGRIKMYVTAQLLRHRRSHPDLFRRGDYHPIEAAGAHAAAVCAFERRYERTGLIVAVCIRPASVSTPDDAPPVGSDSWAKTFLPLEGLPGDAKLRELLTGRELAFATGPDDDTILRLEDVFATMPVAVVRFDLPPVRTANGGE